MKILIAGASGLIGKALKDSLEQSGNQVICLVRSRAEVSDRAIFWDPEHGLVDIASLEGFDAVVNFAGENIFSGRWTSFKKKRILNSRVESTKTLVNALIRLQKPPKVFINASAIGFYGDRGDEICTEESRMGSGFLADVCRQWEAAAMPAQEKGIRTVLLRTGIVLSPEGGALSKMLPPFKAGLGGKLGSGKQYVSWIAIEDLIGIILFVIGNDRIQGPVNAAVPDAIKNEDFSAILGNVLNRPTMLSVPVFALKLLLGNEMAEETVLASTYVEPKKLMEAGYEFKYLDLEKALNDILEKERERMERKEGPKSEKSFVATLLFCILLGTFGVHRFYVGKIGTGILMLITFGGFGIWWLIDLIMIIAMRFRDSHGFLIEP
jgi:uncharacterized protein